MAKHISISLLDAMQAFVDEQVRERGYASSSEYVCALIRKDQDRLLWRGQLVAGASSIPAAPADGHYFEALRQRVRQAGKARACR